LGNIGLKHIDREAEIEFDDHWRYKRLTIPPGEYAKFPKQIYKEAWIEGYKRGKSKFEAHYRLEQSNGGGST
jgi:hypothetical protein